jgi:glycosyltransferase involved in cell wall biosynthesis
MISLHIVNHKPGINEYLVMTTPLVSIIVPNFNHERYLEQRLQSIFNQSYRNFEVILLDDCSTDNSKTVLEKYGAHPKVSKVLYNQKNSGGPFSQWEKGLHSSDGKYVWIAESDDFAELNFLQRLVHLFETDSSLGLVFCNSYWVDHDGKKGKSLSLYNESFYKNGRDEIKTLLQYNTIQNVSAALIRADLAKEAVKGLARYKSCGDWLFYIRLLQSSNIAYLAEPLNYFRWYHNNTSQTASKAGKWITEGIDIISQVDPRRIHITPGHYRAIIIEWFKKVNRATHLPSVSKLVCYRRLMSILIKGIFKIGI